MTLRRLQRETTQPIKRKSTYTLNGSTYFAITPAAMQANSAYSTSDAVGFYVYNPTNEIVSGYYCMAWCDGGIDNVNFKLKANGWTYIELTNLGGDHEHHQFISNGSTVYFYAAFAGEGWKISSFYNQSNIDVSDATVVIDAGVTMIGGDGTVAMNVNDNTFGKVYTLNGSTYFAITPAAMQANSAYSTSDAVGFYVYNPTNEIVSGYYCMAWCDGGIDNVNFKLKANGWTYIELTNLGGDHEHHQFISNGSTVYFYAAFVGEGWKISSFYSLPEPGAN